jgi:hypothetical protein
MTRLIAPALAVAALALAADSARAQTAAPAPTAPRAVAAPGSFYYSNGYYYSRPATTPYYPGVGTRSDSLPGYYSHNGVLRGPSGAMSGRVRHDFDPTGRGVQLYKPWLQPIR